MNLIFKIIGATIGAGAAIATLITKEPQTSTMVLACWFLLLGIALNQED